MKIAICGATIDTENIYMVHEIIEPMEYDGGGRLQTFSFIIESFDNKVLKVVEPIGWYFAGGRYTKNKNGITPKDLGKWEEQTIEYKDLVETPEYLKARKNIETLREEVISLWGNGVNQLIPRLGFNSTYINKQ